MSTGTRRILYVWKGKNGEVFPQQFRGFFFPLLKREKVHLQSGNHFGTRSVKILSDEIFSLFIPSRETPSKTLYARKKKERMGDCDERSRHSSGKNFGRVRSVALGKCEKNCRVSRFGICGEERWRIFHYGKFIW